MSNCKHDLRGDSCPYCENEALRKELKEQKELAQGLEANLKACESHCEEELAALEVKLERVRHFAPEHLRSESPSDSLAAYVREQNAAAEAKLKQLTAEVALARKWEGETPVQRIYKTLTERLSKILSEPSTDSLTAWFREQTNEVVEALKKISKEETYHEYNQHLAAKALAKLKAGRGEK